MPLLKTEPARAIRSVEELFAIAHKLEREAAENYAELAERARTEGIPELGDLFGQLAKEEQEHLGLVESLSEQHVGKKPEQKLDWPLPVTFDMEAANELARSHLATPYKVLSLAVLNEERAFEFWTFVAAQAKSDEIAKFAEKMASTELAHVALLRRARRRAFHESRTARERSTKSVALEGLAEAAALEQELARRLDAMAYRLPERDAARARSLADQSRAMANEAGEKRLESVPGEYADEVALAERLVEAYLEIGERSRDEAVVAKAQSLAKRSIERLAAVRGILLRRADGR